jgi:hypothetical protein
MCVFVGVSETIRSNEIMCKISYVGQNRSEDKNIAVIVWWERMMKYMGTMLS